MLRDQILQLLAHHPSAHFGALAVDDHRQRIHRLGVDQDRQLHQIAFAVVIDVIIETRIAAAHGFQAVIKVEHHFVQRQAVFHQRAIAGIGQVDLPPAPVFTKFQHRPQIFVRHQNRRGNPRFLDLFDPHHIRHIRRIVQFYSVPIRHVNMIDHRRRRRDQIEIELPLQPFANNVEMQKAQKAATHAKAQRRRRFHFIRETGVIQRQLLNGLAQLLELGRIDGEEAAEHDLLRLLESR